MPQFFLYGSNLLVLYTAGNDVIEIPEIGIHVQRKAMHGDPAAAAYPDGAYLPLPARYARIEPHACFTGAPFALQPVFADGFDHHFFQVAQVFADIGTEVLQVEDRVTHDLLQSMKGYIASPVGVKKRDIVGGKFGIAHEHMFLLPAFTKCINRGMFAKEKVVRCL